MVKRGRRGNPDYEPGISEALAACREAFHGNPDNPDTCDKWRHANGYMDHCPCEIGWRKHLKKDKSDV